MLENLHIQNVALIPEIEIEFGAGLNVLTGETGAGKSIIIGSFDFILGSRVDKNVIRTGANFAKVDAVFSAPGAERAKITELTGIEFLDNTIILSRTIKQSGSGECRINGNAVTTDAMRNAASILINIHGQHETDILLRPKNHINILDNFGGQKIISVRNEYNNELGILNDLKKQLKVYGGDDLERKRLIDMYTYQISEIEGARLKVNEDTELSEKKERMQNFERLSNGLASADSLFDGETGISEQLRKLVSSLHNISHIDTRAEKFFETAKSLKFELDDMAGEIQRYYEGLEFDEDEFRRVDARLDEIKILKRKYGSTIEEIFTFLNETQARLELLTKSAEEIEKINTEIEKQENVISDVATRLVDVRREVAVELSSKLIPHLQDLGMPSAKFECKDIGVDACNFYFSANAGEPLKPLANIISGGEMSRFMLAFKAVTANIEGVGTLVFDEIDSGISGIMGHKIAEKMTAIAVFHQVIAVTHLAQIAAPAANHFVIRKHEEGDKTISQISKLETDKEVKEELSRMVGGDEFLKEIKKQ